MRRRSRHHEHRSAIARSFRRARRTINRIRLGPNAVAAMVLVFAGISFVAGLAVGTSKGADSAVARPTTTQSAAAAESSDSLPPWLRSDTAEDQTGGATRAEALNAPFFGRSSFLDPERFADGEPLPPPDPKNMPVSRDALALEAPLLPPQE